MLSNTPRSFISPGFTGWPPRPWRRYCWPDFSQPGSVLFGLLLCPGHGAHRLLVFNGHFFVLWRYLSERRLDPGRFLAYVEDLQARLRTPDFLRAVVAFGSLSRDAFHGSSDFDVRLVWRKGFLNALRAFNFCALERARALLAGFPLDTYVFELREIPRKIRPDEPTIVLMDPEGIFRQRPGGTLSFQAFCNRFREKFLPP